MRQSIAFHDNVMFILSAITAAVFLLIGTALFRKNYHKYLTHGALLEFVWTIVPALILIPIALPSLQLLYSMDEIVNPPLTIKAVGHQWYWSYEYSDYQTETLAFDSYMVPTSDLNKGDFRLVEVDNRLVVPINTHVRVVVTGADVLHSFAVPSLGVKMDAIPGRLNQTSFFAERPGIFYGQCSEICGANHSFMPIVVEAVSPEKYVEWVLEGV